MAQICDREIEIIPYDPKEHGELSKNVPQEFYDQLVGKSYEEQAKYYHIGVGGKTFDRYASDDESTSRWFAKSEDVDIAHDIDVYGFVVDMSKNIIVGVKYYWDIILAGESISEESEDNNGAGYKVTVWYTSLDCILVK